MLSFWASASHADFIDQSHPRSPSGACLDTNFFSPIGQEFIPQFSSLNFVDLFIEDGALNVNPDGVFQVNIRADTVAGTLLGSSTVTHVPDDTNLGGGDTLTRFEFSTPVPLTPGQTHVMEILELTPDFSNYSVCGSLFGHDGIYPGGHAIIDGVPQVGDDFWFAEGIADEPVAFTNTPVFDVKATTDGGGGFTLNEGDISINVQQATSSQVDRRGILEFDIGAIPDGALITSASIQYDVVGLTFSNISKPMVRLFGYAGNGVPDTADAEEVSQQIGIGDPIDTTGLKTIDIDSSFVQTLLGQTDFLGITMLGSEDHNQFSFATLEGAAFWQVSELTILYDPLPADFNGDGIVNGLDANIISLNWLDSPTTKLQGDANRDGVVNGLDANIVSLSWLATNPATANPEPSAILLAVIGVASTISRRRRIISGCSRKSSP